MSKQTSDNSAEPGLRKPVVIGVVGVLAVAFGAMWAFTRGDSEQQAIGVTDPAPQSRPSVVARQPVQTVVDPDRGVGPETVLPSEPADPVPPAAAGDTPPPPGGRQWEQPSGYTRQLVSNLSTLLTTGGPMTPEREAAWNAELDKLRGEGAKGVAAIREYLESNQNVKYSDIAGAEGMQDGSLRQSLLRALNEMGGAEALEVSQQVLSTSLDPREIAMLASTIENEAPGVHRDQIMSAVKASLAQAAGQPVGGVDMNPLFELLQAYGGQDVIAQLEGASSQWRYYSTMALAAVPDGEGIPSLIRMAQGQSLQEKSLAMNFLAQSSAQHGDARDALLEQARLNQIPDSAWQGIADGLSGMKYQYQQSFFQAPELDVNDPTKVHRYNIRYGNQNYLSLERADRWTAEERQQQLATIDQLAGLTGSAAAREALEAAKAKLLALP